MTTIARGSLWICVLTILSVSSFVLPSITSAQFGIPDQYNNARVFCKITEKGTLHCVSPSDILAAIKESRLETIISQIMAELLAKYPEQDDPFACGDGSMYFVREQNGLLTVQDHSHDAIVLIHVHPVASNVTFANLAIAI